MADDTRDIAIRAEAMVDQHMTDCTAFREALQNTLAEFRDDIKKMNWRIALIVGGFISVSKAIDMLLALKH